MIEVNEEYNSNLNVFIVSPYKNAQSLMRIHSKETALECCRIQLNVLQNPNWLQNRIDYWLDVINELNKL